MINRIIESIKSFFFAKPKKSPLPIVDRTTPIDSKKSPKVRKKKPAKKAIKKSTKKLA